MAVAARPTAAAGNTASLKIALVAFVCLTVASLAFAIWLYTGREELIQTAEEKAKAAQAATQKEQETRDVLKAVALRVVGKPIDDPVEVNSSVETSVAGAFGRDAQSKLLKEAGINPGNPLVTTLQDIYQNLTKKAEQVDALEADRKKLTDELGAKTVENTKRAEQFTAEAEQIKAKLAELEKQVADNRTAWARSLGKIRQQSVADAERASEQLTAERSQRKAIEEQLNQSKSRIDELVATLATFRPSADLTSLLQIADGNIVQTVPDQKIVYISIGKRDHIKPGMTFAVYSQVRGIPADGKGKASIKVNNVFDTTSECAITSAITGDPVVEGDVIANPVYDRSRQYNFVVAGEFDLNFDGKIDDPAGEQVCNMIREWGGNLQSAVDTRTDFVVLGSPPPDTMGKAAGSGPGQQADPRKAFDIAKQEARSLGIPVLTRTQFLHFIGFSMPNNAKDDEKPT
jgi:hypothetical protein